MSSREEKWNEIRQEYHAHSMSKEQVNHMKKKIRQAKKENRHIVRTIASVAAAAAVALAILPNASGSIAYAMSRIPILSKWVEVVTLRDYQYESDRNNANIKVPEIVPQIPEEEADSTEARANAQQKIQKSAEEINAEIKTITDQLIAEFQEYASDQEGYQNVQTSSEVLATTDQYFTLKLNCYQASGSGAEWNYYYTIDLATGERLQLKDLFTKGSDYITPISENIKQQMKTQMEEDENVFYWVDYEDVPEWNFEAITDETQFYLNDRGEVVICFNEGDVAPMYMGCVTFTIPNEALASRRKQDTP